MKKLFYFAVMLFALAACNEADLENDQVIEVEPITLDGCLADYCDYDVNSVTEILCGKEWVERAIYRYTEGWSELLKVGWGLDEKYPYILGYDHDTYVFHPDGVMEIFGRSYLGEDTHDVLQWKFDPETRIIKFFNRTEHHLIALGEDILIWDYIDNWSNPENPFYFRRLRVTKERWDEEHNE